ncbi:MAG: copper amine oxidase N-terminal domain-containing protein [Candidatus Eremiobacteraeota bacterium]|nr:copper amine oxidase N-terminal domain-containing protein [Candidatus Eremiobacteraeota bacterium]
MKHLVLLLAFLLASSPTVASGPKHAPVSINDRPVEIQGVVFADKVLVPMRALFTELGATVEYDAEHRTVHARNGNHRIALVVGTHGARIMHYRTYVPLRYVAQALGAVVDYDSTTDSVAIYSGSPAAKNAVSRAALPIVTHRYPEPAERIENGRPTVAATVESPNGGAIERRSLHFYLDGLDVMNRASFDGSTVSYTPSSELDYGRHDVLLEGVDENGLSFRSQWWFQAMTRSGYSMRYGVPGYYVNGGDIIPGFRFYPTGPTTYFPGDLMQFVLIAPPGGNAFVQFCGIPQVFNFNYNAAFNYYITSLPAPRRFFFPSCSVNAVFTGSNGLQTVIPLHSKIRILTTSRRHWPGTWSKRIIVPSISANQRVAPSLPLKPKLHVAPSLPIKPKPQVAPITPGKPKPILSRRPLKILFPSPRP